MLTGQSGCAPPVKYRPLLRVSRRKACPFLEVQLPRFQRGGAAESDPSRKSIVHRSSRDSVDLRGGLRLRPVSDNLIDNDPNEA
jgi:hypothetical protein